MTAAILSWLAEQGLGLLLGAAFGFARDAMADRRNAEAQRDAGAAEAANKVNVETVETKDAMANVPRPSNDVVADRLQRGEF